MYGAFIAERYYHRSLDFNVDTEYMNIKTNKKQKNKISRLKYSELPPAVVRFGIQKKLMGTKSTTQSSEIRS